MKRIFDICISLALVLVLAPILVLLFVGVRFSLGSPALFRQERPGLNDQPFEMVKFRTMRDAYHIDGTPLPDEERLTRFGKFLRSSSLDELPELFNVLKGEMSLVGPRPLLMEYLPLYTDQQRRRHEVKPGITGLAQVHGRNLISWEKKFEYDVWYVDNWSIKLDIKIMLMTVKAMVFATGINEAGQVTVTRFKGGDDKC